jgi:hypothetical protein
MKRGRRRREEAITTTVAAVDIMAAVSVRSAGPVMVARKNAGKKELELSGGVDLDQKEEGEKEEEGGTASETPDPSR